MATSTQDMVRPGECVDLYYYDGETSRKQCFPTTVNTRYVQQFANLTGGSSVFTIPPQNGIQDVVLNFIIPSLAPGDGNGIAIPRGWGYALIKQVSFRYGGSSQYFLTGDQILQNALRKQPNRQAADDILALGGSQLTGTELEGVAPVANVVLTLPHNIPSGVGKSHPLPTDALTQQVQVTVEILPLSSIVSVNAPATGLPSGYASGLASAQFQVQQVMLNNQGDALARRVDMATNAYAYPCEFVQQKQTIALANTANSQSVVLTGFRSGEVKAIHIWLTRSGDATGANTGAILPNYWYLPNAVQMTYAGEIFARFDSQGSALWNLINGNKLPVVDTVLLGFNGGNYTATPAVSPWVELPFAQTMVDEDSHYTLVHGKPITNGIVNLDLTTPSAEADWQLNVSYIYNATLLFSQGSCDYVF